MQTRGDLRPDPDYDPIRAIFYNVSNDVPSTSDKPAKITGNSSSYIFYLFLIFCVNNIAPGQNF